MSEKGPTTLHQENFSDQQATRNEPALVQNIQDYDDQLIIQLSNTECVSGIKTTDDGTVLIPQPSDDPTDPLNWSSGKKHAILICLSLGAFLGEFGALIPIPGTIVQSQEWGLTLTKANYPTNLAVAMIGVAAIVAVPALNYWGRMPVLFWSTFCGFGFTLGAALAPSYSVFYAMRALQGLTQATAPSIFLAFINDMFFFHERARKIGIFYTLFLTSPFLGPLVGSFMTAYLGQWRPAFWLVVAMAGGLLGGLVAFGDETYYHRQTLAQGQPRRGQRYSDRLSRITGVWQIRSHGHYFAGVLESYQRMLMILLKPIVTISITIYGIAFMWAVGITNSSAILLATPVQYGGYGVDSKVLGFFYFTPILGVLIGEVVGHHFNDFLVRSYARRHHHSFVPEARLWTTYLGGALMIPGLVIVGQALQHRLHWVALVFGWGMHQTGTMLMSVAISAYVLDCHPSAAGEVCAWLNAFRALLGFSVAYFLEDWGHAQGYGTVFGVQAAVTSVAVILIGLVHYYGRRIRLWSGPFAYPKV